MPDGSGLAPTFTKQPTRCVVFYSGGKMSWAAGKRAAAKYGAENTTLLFTDTLIEAPDCYRFLREGAANIGAELVWIKDGRTPFQVFRDEKLLGSKKHDPCSKMLKRRPAERWLRENRDPADTALVFGIDWQEDHRFDGPPRTGKDERTGVKNRYGRMGWQHVEAPMMDSPWMRHSDIDDWLEREGIRRSVSYAEGFSHDNCGGGCVKAGRAHWRHLLRTRPAVFAMWEREEAEFNASRPGKKLQTILNTERPGLPSLLVTLREFRESVEGGAQVDMFDVGGCGCFVDAD